MSDPKFSLQTSLEGACCPVCDDKLVQVKRTVKYVSTEKHRLDDPYVQRTAWACLSCGLIVMLRRLGKNWTRVREKAHR